jgi:hemoglobin/transferrin/lactoferrin receptor protein
MIRLKLTMCLIFAVTTLFNSFIYAQSNESKSDSISFYLPWVTVTANRYEKNVFETHIPVSMVREREVWQKGIDNVGELIQQNAGVSFTSAGPWSQKLVIRGLTGPQVLTLVDGMRLEVLRSYGNHAPLIDVDQIERIEIIRGPASILYGSDAIGGVVNFITKKPGILTNGFAIKGNLGIQYSSVNQQYDENCSINGNLKNWFFLFGLTNRRSEDIDTPKGKLANTGFNGYTIDTKIGYSLSKMHQFQIMAQSNRLKDVGVPIDPYALSAKFLKYNRDLITLSYEYRVPNLIWSNAKVNIYYQTGERNFDAFIYQKPKGSLFINQTLTANRNVDAYGANFQSSFAIFNQNLLTAGIDYFAEYDDTRRIADPAIYSSQGAIVKDPPADLTPPTPKSNRNGIGVFLEDEYTPWQKWTFTMGIRFDYILSQAEGTMGTLVEKDRTERNSDFSGNLGLLYRLSENLHLMGNIGRAFKAPTLQERYFRGTAQVGFLSGNPDLNSEKSLNLDAGIKWKYSILSGELNLFRNQIDEFIVMKPVSSAADTFWYDNVGKALLYGGEFQTNLNLSKNIFIFLNSAYVHGQDVNLDEPLPKISPLEGTLGFRYDALKKDYWFEVTVRFVNKQDRVAENELKTDGYNLFNFSSGINLNKFLKLKSPLFLTLNVRNIFNESYRDHLSSVFWWDAPGRNVVVGLRSNF